MTPEVNLDSIRLHSPELLVVIPVYNEQASIGEVVREWMDELGRCCHSFVLLAIDDGSKDASLTTLRQLQERWGERLQIVTRPNRGHGQTCLEGYRRAATMGAPYVFQIDSDGQCDPRYFQSVWQLREQFSVVYGVRTTRDDGLARVFVSRVLRLMLLAAFQVNCRDANTPYRLMRTNDVMWAVNRIPPDFGLANIALAVQLAMDRKCSHGFVPIRFRQRSGGQPSVKASMFGRKAFELYRDIRKMRGQPQSQ
jgi:dolichol-phosphate mannosyltransferase